MLGTGCLAPNKGPRERESEGRGEQPGSMATAGATAYNASALASSRPGSGPLSSCVPMHAYVRANARIGAFPRIYSSALVVAGATAYNAVGTDVQTGWRVDADATA